MPNQDWMSLLDQLRRSLEQTQVDLAQHEALAAHWPNNPADPERDLAWQQALHRFDERMQQHGQHLDQVQQIAADADQSLAAQQEEVKQFQQRLLQIRDQLAKLAPGL